MSYNRGHSSITLSSYVLANIVVPPRGIPTIVIESSLEPRCLLVKHAMDVSYLAIGSVLEAIRTGLRATGHKKIQIEGRDRIDVICNSKTVEDVPAKVRYLLRKRCIIDARRYGFKFTQDGFREILRDVELGQQIVAHRHSTDDTNSPRLHPYKDDFSASLDAPRFSTPHETS